MIYKYRKEDMSLTYVGNKIMSLIFILIFFVGIVSFLGGKAHSKTVYITEEGQSYIISQEKDTFTEQKLYEYLVELNVKHPEIVIAQARLETGNYSSEVFRQNNNLFGMKEARIRISTNQGTNLGHAVYENWKQCVLDYAFYQATYLSDLKKEKDYLNYLDRSYAEDPNYINKVQKIAAKIKST